MQSIERYGVVALVLLVVTVGAVLIWHRRDKDTLSTEAERSSASHEERAATRVAANASTAAENPSAESNRVTLRAEPSGRPLWRAKASKEPDPDPRVGATPESADPAAMSGSAGPKDGDIAPVKEREPVAEEAAQSSTRTYVVRASDTLSEIAERELGTQRRWTEILALNPGLAPTQLRAGQKIALPSQLEAKAGASPAVSSPPKETTNTPVSPRAASKKPERSSTSSKEKASTPTRKARTYLVQKGDSLWRIADRALGDGGRWKEIAALNPKVNPDRLAAGQELVLPDGAKPEGPKVVVASNTEPAKVNGNSSARKERKVR